MAQPHASWSRTAKLFHLKLVHQAQSALMLPGNPSSSCLQLFPTKQSRFLPWTITSGPFLHEASRSHHFCSELPRSPAVNPAVRCVQEKSPRAQQKVLIPSRSWPYLLNFSSLFTLLHLPINRLCFRRQTTLISLILCAQKPTHLESQINGLFVASRCKRNGKLGHDHAELPCDGSGRHEGEEERSWSIDRLSTSTEQPAPLV